MDRKAHWFGLGLLICCLGGCATAPSNPYLADSETTLRVKTALMNTSIVDYSMISVTTNNGVVELNGYVSSDQEQELAGTTAEGVPGVNQVENNLVVKASD